MDDKNETLKKLLSTFKPEPDEYPFLPKFGNNEVAFNLSKAIRIMFEYMPSHHYGQGESCDNEDYTQVVNLICEAKRSYQKQQ